MEITYIGHSCFKLKGKNLTVVMDPYDPDKVGYKLPKLEADVVTISHGHFDHNHTMGVTGHILTLKGAGEYETKDVSFYGIETFHDDSKGSERGKNTMFLVEMDGFTILHAGDLGHELDQETLEKIPNVDVLLIPVGGTYTIDAKVASKVIAELEPGFVVPMHYQTKDLALSEKLAEVSKFLDEMGDEDAKPTDKLKLASKSDIPDETTVVVLSPQH